ncbi:MAG: hypothetical protein RDU20_15210 [Desulfomonilaceae bacterium]|nr:hypothetical protein [Desulfomonilaceae bacterium]
MNRTLIVLSVCMVLVLSAAPWSDAGMFVATAKNLRGALYQGFGPTPGHASEMAVVKCSQDSFIPPSCKVVCVRMEMPPVAYAPKVRKPVAKSRPFMKSGGPPPPYSWGRPHP